MTEDQFIKQIFKLYILLKFDHPFEFKRDAILEFYERTLPFFKELKKDIKDKD